MSMLRCIGLKFRCCGFVRVSKNPWDTASLNCRMRVGVDSTGKQTLSSTLRRQSENSASVFKGTLNLTQKSSQIVSPEQVLLGV